MPILSTIGRRTPAARLIIAAMYAALILGGATMLYPFLLMISTAVTSETDYSEYRLIPRYLFEDEARYTKVLAEKYQQLDDFRLLHDAAVRDFAQIRMPAEEVQSAGAVQAVEDWRAFKRTLEPREFGVWYVGRRSLPGRADLLWRDFLAETLEDDVSRLRVALQSDVSSFAEVFALYEQPTSRLWSGIPGRKGELWQAFKRSLDPAYRRPIDATALWRVWLRSRYERIENFNRAVDAAFTSFEAVPFSASPPKNLRLAADWVQFVTQRLPYHTVAIVNGDARYRAFLVEHYGDDVDAINSRLGTSYAALADVRWPPLEPGLLELSAVSAFLTSGIDVRDLRVVTPDLTFISFIRQKYGDDVSALNNAWGVQLASFDEARPPYEHEDLWEFKEHRGQWMIWFLTRNFAEVLDFIAVRGYSLWNTFILVVAMIACALTVNPLAAYALSRFNLGYTNQVLLFLLATMAFPYEVTMIPGFLLLREFPLWSGLAALMAGALAAMAVLHRDRGRRVWLAALAGCVSAAMAASGVSVLLSWATGSREAGSISLLNTYAALILPGAASGYSIFLLKGFFDSLPEELFEAARIDGAGELRMLWQIAVPLCKPILAVIVLFTFTATYGSYIWALIVCQDERMWTLMVHIFQLQQWAPPYLTMAANVLASLPTLIVFIVAQNMIMRGIIIPTYK
ncbi:MAG TPA: carbohydrate ABC transporter permease [Phycisphaeraceae bacterium]